MFILVRTSPWRHLPNKWTGFLTKNKPDQTKIADLVQIRPAQFAKLSIDAIEDNLNEKYCNKVRIAAQLFPLSAS